MKDSQLNPTVHPPETLIAAYAIGKCSQEMQAEIDEHCFTCESCRTRLSILLRLSSLDGNDLERQELERLFPLGKETIAQARQPIGLLSEALIKEKLAFSSESSVNLERQSPARNFSSSPQSFFRKSTIQVAAVAMFAVALACGGYYWYASAHSPVQNSLLAIQRSYQLSRPIEARLSGGLEYKPYAPSRGNIDGGGVNRDQIDYALAELTRVVASNPTPQERHALGRLYLFLGDFDRAEIQMKIALETLKRDAKLHTDLAALYYERSNYSEADRSSLLHQAIEHYGLAIGIDSKSAEAWFNRALCYEKLSLFLKAKDDWTQYLKIDTDPGSKWAEEARERLSKLESKAINSNTQKKKEDLTALFDNAINSSDLNALQVLQDQYPTATAQFASSDLLGRYLTASIEKKHQQADLLLSGLKKIGQTAKEKKGDSFISDLADFAARASPEMKERMLSVHLELRQADQEYSRSSHDTAFKKYQSALQSAQRFGDELHAEVATSNLIRYSHNKANTESLVALGNRLVVQTEKLHHRQLQAQTHAALANAYLASQQGTLALENSLRAVTIAKEIGDKDTAVTGLILACTAYTRSGNYKLGINKSLEVLTNLNDNSVSQYRTFQAYQLIWEPLFRQGSYSLALEYQKEALHIAKILNHAPGIYGSLGRIGLNLWKLNQNSEAEGYLQEAIARCNSINDKTLRQLLQTELYTALGDVSLSLGKNEISLSNYEIAYNAISASKNSVYLSAIYQGQASAYLAQNKIYEAEAKLQQSIALLEKNRQQISDASSRSIFLLRSQSAYKAMVDLQFYFKRDYGAAFYYAEVARNRNALDKTTLSSTKTALSLSGHSRALRLKDVQNNLPLNSQLLAYTSTEKGLLIWLVTSKSFYSTSVEISETTIKTAITDYLVSLSSRKDEALIKQKSAELYRVLILPIGDRLNSKHLLYIIQDGELSQLPFTTLFSRATERYLIEDYSIVINNSTSVLAKTLALARNKTNSNNESFVGISNPRFSYRRFPGLPPLPSSDEEVAQASKLYKYSKLYSQDGATESKTIQQIQNHNIVHIASHTINNKDNILSSAIVLAEDKDAHDKSHHLKDIFLDGTLQAGEIYQLKFPQTRLVILSSCSSGLGDLTKGETMGALAQAFLAVNVPNVIASLWDVDDKSSSDLMSNFHNNHRLKSLDFAQSLRQAQCAMIQSLDKDKRHPYYWASFQVQGAGI